MPSTIYVNANELNLARQEAAGTIENHMYYEYRGPALLPPAQLADEIHQAAHAQAAAIFDRPEYLTNLLRDQAIRNPGLAQAIEQAVHERITGRRTALRRKAEH